MMTEPKFDHKKQAYVVNDGGVERQFDSMAEAWGFFNNRA